MSMPTVKVEAGFGFGVFDTVTTWVDLTSRVGYPGGIHWSYGRSSELETADAGIGHITFDNSDRALDPTNTASPYWPNVKPMVPIRCTATHNATSRDVFYAYAEGWPPQWKGSEFGWVTVPIVDGFKTLSMARTSAGYPQQLSGARIGALLDAAGWPAGRRSIDPGRSLIQEYQASQRIILNALKDTAKAEQGLFFVAPNGNATFLDRDTLFFSSAASLATFSEPSGLPYERVEVSYDDMDIWNDIAIYPIDSGVRRAQDTASQSAFGRRELVLAEMPIEDLVADDMAFWLLGRYANPELRVRVLALEGDLFSDGGTDVLQQILVRRVGDRVTVEGQPAGGGAPLSTLVGIRRVSHWIEATSWRTIWRLEPTYESDAPWLIGVAGRSELGQTTRLGF